MSQPYAVLAEYETPAAALVLLQFQRPQQILSIH